MTVTVAQFAGKISRGLIVAAFGLTGAVVSLGTAPASAQPEVATDAWIKICRTDEKTKKEMCKTAFDLRTAGGQFLASMSVVEVSGEARKIVEFIMPTGLLLQAGLKVQIDQNKSDDAKFGMCVPDGCVAQMVSSDALVAQMKKGTTFAVTAQGQAANPVTFSFPLATFKASNEGKALDEATLKKREEAIRADIEQKQNSIEEQLREEQRKAQQATP